MILRNAGAYENLRLYIITAGLLLTHSSQADKEATFTSRIVEWGERNRKQFPWRQTSDPYSVFVAECLVQRTKADQAQPVYLRFLETFPNIESLSKARESKIRLVVSTLGLAYRAKRMRTLARELLKLFGGQFPDNLPALKQLYGKGMGDYMAHAILCFAYGSDVPVVDKNVERILKRVFSFECRKDGHQKSERA